MATRVKLLSDFKDYYDGVFDPDGQVFFRNRFRKGSKRQVLNTLSRIFSGGGFSVIPHGLVLEMPSIIKNFYKTQEPIDDFLVVSSRLVVYTEGTKLLAPIGVATELYPKEFSTLYIFTWPFSGSSSIRWLQIGRIVVILKYISYTSWNSREGEVDVIVKRIWRVEDPIKLFGSPIFAIDFVSDGKRLYALDMEVNPVLQGTGVEDYISPEEVKEEVSVSLDKEAKELLEFSQGMPVLMSL